ncbi:hypothetical protein KAH94_03915 [bacterium]|nr:hypothetical protein [bacterium]
MKKQYFALTLLFLIFQLTMPAIGQANNQIYKRYQNIRCCYKQELLVKRWWSVSLEKIIINNINKKAMAVDTFCSSPCNRRAAYSFYLAFLEQDIHFLESANQNTNPKFSMLCANLKKILQVAKQIEIFKKIKCPKRGLHSSANRKKLEKTLSQQNK